MGICLAIPIGKHDQDVMNPIVSKFLRSVALALLAAAVYLAVKYFMGHVTGDLWWKVLIAVVVVGVVSSLPWRSKPKLPGGSDR